MSETIKKTYYKLGNRNISVFYDHVNHLKVTRNVPGVCEKITKQTQAAIRGGHITEINGEEYNSMIEKLTAEEKKGIFTHIPDKAALNGGVDSSEDKVDEEKEKEELTKRVKALNLKKPEEAKILAKSNEDIKAFLEENEN